MERVSIIDGKTPCVFIAPHGEPGGDINTGIIAKAAAEALDGYAVINNGWSRGAVYNYDKEICDCNNVSQLVDVPADEFLAPIIRFKNRIRKKYTSAYLFYIHGIANDVCDKAKDNSLSMIIGYGAGNPASYTCKNWMKDLLIYECQQHGWTTYEGKAGGAYSAWTRNNLCQFFRKWQFDPHVQAMQLEIIYDLRDSKAKAQLCGECLADFVREVINRNNWDQPKNFRVKQF